MSPGRSGPQLTPAVGTDMPSAEITVVLATVEQHPAVAQLDHLILVGIRPRRYAADLPCLAVIVGIVDEWLDGDRPVGRRRAAAFGGNQ